MSDMYVERADGVIIGAYANLQPGLAEELVASDTPELVAFLNPPPPTRTVLKSVIISRLIDAGKIEAARAALDQDAAAYARWWAPDRPAINYDDPDALALLQAIGADPQVILAE